LKNHGLCRHEAKEKDESEDPAPYFVYEVNRHTSDSRTRRHKYQPGSRPGDGI